jgi:DNA-damage-inducible protein D
MVLDALGTQHLTHYQVGAKVRQTIKELGGTMPEDLPTAESIKAVEKKKQKLLDSKNKESNE